MAAIRALEPHLVGLDVEVACADLGGPSRSLTGDSQLRWLGPEKGVMHVAIRAVVNAFWDLAARRAGLPVWQLLARMTPEQLVDLVDWRYLSDALTREQTLELLCAKASGRAVREAELLAGGYPAYTTSAGWLGYSEDKIVQFVRQALADGFTLLKPTSAGTSGEAIVAVQALAVRRRWATCRSTPAGWAG